MSVEVFQGDIADAPAEAICTSTNPRLSLMMGSGGSVRERGGFEVLRACEEVLARNGGTPLPPGSVHVTTAGRLPFKAAIHCVASNTTHMSSEAIIQVCVKNALRAAEELGCASVAMPVFATGHAHVKFDRALAAMREALRDTLLRVIVVVYDPGRVEQAAQIFRQ